MEINPNYIMMTDNSDGTYSASYSSSAKGTATLIAYLLVPNKVFVMFYSDKIFTPPAVYNETWPQIDKNYTTNDLYPSVADNTSATINFMIKVPYTEEYTFTLESNDGSDLYMNSTIKISQLGVTCNCSSSFDTNLTQGDYVDFKIDYNEIEDEAHLKLFWNSSSSISSSVLVPSSMLYYKEYIGIGAYQTEIKCPEYYSGNNEDHPGECYEICGDGIHIGREV